MNGNPQSMQTRLTKLETKLLNQIYGVIFVSSVDEIPSNFEGTAIIDDILDVDDIPLKVSTTKRLT